jgi:hypothetical protein
MLMQMKSRRSGGRSGPATRGDKICLAVLCGIMVVCFVIATWMCFNQEPPITEGTIYTKWFREAHTETHGAGPTRHSHNVPDRWWIQIKNGEGKVRNIVVGKEFFDKHEPGTRVKIEDGTIKTE